LTSLKDKAYVLHRCDNPACCRPDHLFTGDQLLNMRDASSKGRIPSGERSYYAKVTHVEAEQIRAIYAERSANQAEIAAQFGLHPSSVSRLVRCESYVKK